MSVNTRKRKTEQKSNKSVRSDPANTSLAGEKWPDSTEERRASHIYIEGPEEGEGRANLLVPRILVTKTDILSCASHQR